MPDPQVVTPQSWLLAKLPREEACQRALTQKPNSSELVREAGGLLERSQRQIAREALRESSSSFGAKLVALQTASTGVPVEAGTDACQGALTLKRTLWSDGALQLLEHAIALDAACDDDGGGDAQPLA